MKVLVIITILFCSIFVYSCDSDTPKQQPEEVLEEVTDQITAGPAPEEEAPKASTTNKAAELQQFLTSFNAENNEIPSEFIQSFIAVALREEQTYSYSKYYEYSYGSIVYTNDDFVAISFKLAGDNGESMLEGDFIATFNVSDGSLIDSELVGSASDFEWHSSRGYNMNHNLSYTVGQGDANEVAFVINCEESKEYYNFNEEYVVKGEEPKDENNSFSHTVDMEGLFSGDYEG